MPLKEDTRILIVEDEEALRVALERVFKAEGFTLVTFVEDGEKALLELEKGEFEAVVSDYSMPNKNGMELLMEMRRDDRYKKIVFIMMSASRDEILKERALGHGAHGYIRKLSLFDDFLGVLRLSLKQK